MHAVDQIKEVIMPYSNHVPVPGASSYIDGIINVRGELITLVSGRKLFNLNRPPNEVQRILVIENCNELIGVKVDSIGSIEVLDPEKIEPLHQNDNPLVKGTYKLKDILYILTDFTGLKGPI